MGIMYYCVKIKGDGVTIPFAPDLPTGVDWTCGCYDKEYKNILVNCEQEVAGATILTEINLTAKCTELGIDKVKFKAQKCIKEIPEV